ncbi:MAG: glycosyltransferase family 2 protein, partial [Planctomycetota bacterium]
MTISVLIPTIGRPEALCRLLQSLEQQTLPRVDFEVLVGVDGGSKHAQPSPIGPCDAVLSLPAGGPAATRNALVRRSTGDLVLFLNDDVVADPGLLERHATTHSELAGGAMVLGAAPWRIEPQDTIFDRLIRETSMVFFYDRMDAADAPVQNDHDWGYRHAWTLNLSAPRSIAAEHRFDERLTRPMFEDIEWAWRAGRDMPCPVLYRPEARVVHAHRYEPADYLRRERELGRQAVRLAEINPGCAAETFRGDLLDPAFIDRCQQRIEQDAAAVEPLVESFRLLADIPSSAVTDPRLV